MVRLAVSRREPLSIRLQVAEQLRHQIESGILPAGSRLPTIRELAAELRLNYNTVRRIYGDLEAEGYVVSSERRGTFVAERPPRAGNAALSVARDLVDEALARAIVAGISAAEFARMTYTRAKLFRRQRKPPRLLFSECNTTELHDFAAEIAAATGIAPATYLLTELQRKRRPFFAAYDLLITTFAHVRELAAMAGAERNVVGVTLEPDYRGVVATIAELPPGSKIGLVCSSQRAAEAMAAAVEAAGLRGHKLVPASPSTLRRLASVRRTYVSRQFMAEHPGATLPAPVLPYDIHVTPTSLRYLRQQIERVLLPAPDARGAAAEAASSS